MNSLLTQGMLLTTNGTVSNDSGNPFSSIAYFLVHIANDIKPYAYVAAGIMVLILGFMLILGGSRQREQVKSHFKIIIIALLIILGAPTIASFFSTQSGNAFGNKDFNQVILPLIDFIKIKF